MKPLSWSVLVFGFVGFVCTTASADIIYFTEGTWETQDGIETVTITNLEFSFDQIPTGSVIGPSGSWSMNLGGVDVEVSRPGSWLEIVDTTPYNQSNFNPNAIPDDWGAHVLSPFIDYMNPADIVFTVTIPVGLGIIGMSIHVGDFGGSDLDRVLFAGKEGFLTNPPGSDPEEFYFFRTDGFPMSDTGMVARGARAGAPGLEQTAFWDDLVVQVVAEDDLPTAVVAPGLPGVGNPTGGAGFFPGQDLPIAPIPEPATGALLLAGGLMLALLSRKKLKR